MEGLSRTWARPPRRTFSSWLMSSEPSRGEIWLVRFEPSQGAEIDKTRPAVVVNRGVEPLRHAGNSVASGPAGD